MTCSAVFINDKNERECKNNFYITGACLVESGTPVCMNEKLCGRLYPLTGSPLKEREEYLRLKTILSDK